MTDHAFDEQIRRDGMTVLLVNAENNPDAALDTDSFEYEWFWVRAPAGWTPEDGLSEDADAVDAVVVFSTKYEERAIRDLCESIRANSNFAGCPLLVAVSQYEMPLANRVKEMKGGDFVFTPIREQDLLDHLERARDSQ